MCWSWYKKKSTFFVTFILSKGNFFLHLCFISVYDVLNKLSELYTLHFKKYYYIYFCLFLKSSMKAFSISLSNKQQRVMFLVTSQLDLQLCSFVFFGVSQLYLHARKIGYSTSGRCSV